MADAKFRFIIPDVEQQLYGTNDEEKAKKLAEKYMVWDCTTGEYVAAEWEVVSTQGESDISEVPADWFETTDPATL